MKKWAKRWLFTGIGACFLGGSLVAIGWGYNGFSELQTLTSYTYYEPRKIEKQISEKVTMLDAHFIERNVEMMESPDDQFHLIYSKEKDGKDTLHAHLKDGTLTIKEELKTKKEPFQAGLKLVFELFSSTEGSRYKNVILQIPKGVVLENARVENKSGSINIKNLHLKKAQIGTQTGLLFISENKIEESKLYSRLGLIALSFSDLSQSTVENQSGEIAINNMERIYSNHFRIQSGSISIDSYHDSNDSEKTKGKVENSTIQAQSGEIRIFNQELIESQLESQSGAIVAQDMMLTKTVHFKTVSSLIDLGINQESLDNLSYQLSSKRGMISFLLDSRKDWKTNKAELTYEHPSSKNKVVVESVTGDILFGLDPLLYE